MDAGGLCGVTAFGFVKIICTPPDNARSVTPVSAPCLCGPHAASIQIPSPGSICTLLVLQVTSPVQWETTMKTLLDKGLEQSYEIGPNKVIAGIMKRISKTSPITNITV